MTKESIPHIVIVDKHNNNEYHCFYCEHFEFVMTDQSI